jgi:hypothetical protein
MNMVYMYLVTLLLSKEGSYRVPECSFCQLRDRILEELAVGVKGSVIEQVSPTHQDSHLLPESSQKDPRK